MDGSRTYHPSEPYRDNSSSSRFQQPPHNEYDYDEDYEHNHPSYPPPPVSNYNPAYGSDHKSAIDDDPYSQPKPDPLYPPTLRPYPFAQSSAPSLRPSISTDISSTPSKQNFASADLESYGTDDGDRPIHPAPNLKSTDTETGWKAAVSNLLSFQLIIRCQPFSNTSRAPFPTPLPNSSFGRTQDHVAPTSWLSCWRPSST